MISSCPADVLKQLKDPPYNVSRETFEKINIYVSVLLQENKTHNLIGKSTEDDIWHRHILDSLQLLSYIKNDPQYSILDLGSGAGLPGVLLSFVLKHTVTLLDARQKKCFFLENVSRETFSPFQVVWSRIEDHLQRYDMIVSRGFAAVDKTLSLAYKNIAPDGVFLLLKGKTAMQEIKEAQKKWDFHFERYSSITNKEGCILRLTQIKKKHDSYYQHCKSKRGRR